mgnify:CR=1 FL=1
MPKLRCRACLVSCMDFRLHEPLRRFITAHDLDRDGVDVVRIAGVAKNLARPASPWEREFLLNQLKASVRLHEIREVFLVNHEDCGAYGLENVPDPEEELTLHAEDLRAAKEIVLRELPDVSVHTYFMRLDGRASRVD